MREMAATEEVGKRAMAYSSASFGYTDEEWESLIAATDDWLTEKISTTFRELPHYSDVNREVARRTGLRGFDMSIEQGRNGIGWLLGDLNDRLWDEARCLVSSVVVHKGDLVSPIGKGFYTYARKWNLNPGPTRAEQEDFLLTQQIAAVRFWQARRFARRSR
jgi:hypothetical protein